MYPERALSELHRDAAQLRPVAAEQPGLRSVHHRQRGQAREVPQLQRDGATSAPGQLLDDGCLHRRTRPRSACSTCSTSATGATTASSSIGSRSMRSARYGDLLFSNLSSQPQLGIPLPYPGFAGTVQQALRPFPQYTDITALNNFRGKTRYNSLQTTLERHFNSGFSLVAAYTLSKTEDNYLKQDASGEEWALAGRGPSLPTFPEADLDLRAADRARQSGERQRRARSDRRRLDDHGHPQLPHRRHNQRLRQPHQQPRQHRIPLPSRHRRRCRPHHL